jgi:hypothetical protein
VSTLLTADGEIALSEPPIVVCLPSAIVLLSHQILVPGRDGFRQRHDRDDGAAGSRFGERLLSVVLSCRQQGRPLLEFLVAASLGLFWGARFYRRAG